MKQSLFIFFVIYFTGFCIDLDPNKKKLKQYRDEIIIRNIINNKMLDAVINQKVVDFQKYLEKGADINYCGKFGRSAIFYAIKHYAKSKILFNSVLSAGADVNISDINGKTPLISSVYDVSDKEFILIFKLLVKAGANIFISDLDGNNIFMHMIKKNAVGKIKFLLSTNFVKLLLQKKNLNDKNVIEQTIILNKKKIYDDIFRLSPNSVSLEEQFFAFVKFKKQVDHRFITAKFNINHQLKWLKNKTLLMYMIENYKSHQSLFNAVLGHSNLDVNVSDSSGKTPLMYAILKLNDMNNIIKICTSLLKKKADLYARDLVGNTVFMHILKENKNINLIKWFLLRDSKKILVNIPNFWGETPLMLVAKKGNYELFHFLVKRKSKKETLDYRGINLLMYAVIGGNIKIIKQNLSKKNINYQDQYGRTALMYAVIYKRNLEIISSLINLRPKDMQDQYGRTALMYCLKNKNTYEIYLKLLSQIKNFKIKDKKNITLAMYACRYGKEYKFINNILNKNINKKAVDDYGRGLVLHILMNKNIEKSSFLNQFNNLNKDIDGEDISMYALTYAPYKDVISILNKKIKLTGINKNTQKTFLMMAVAKYKKRNQFSNILKKFKNFNVQDKKGKTALIYAVENNNFEAIKSLLQEKININIGDEEGKTALMYAIQKKLIKLIIIFLENGRKINFNAQDKKGKTVLMYALQTGKEDIVNLIRAKVNWGKKTKDKKMAAHFAIMGGNNLLFKMALKKSEMLINYVDVNDKTLLMYAAHGNKVIIFKEILKLGGDIKLRDNFGRTFLHYVELGKARSIGDLFLNQLDKKNSLDEKQKVDLKQNSLNLLDKEELLTYYNLLDKNNRSAMMYSMNKSFYNFYRSFHFLNKKKIDDKNRTMFIYAATMRNREVIQFLLNNKVSYNHIDTDGRTGLMYILKNADINSLQNFMENRWYSNTKSIYKYDGSGRESFLRKIILSKKDSLGTNSLMYMSNFYPHFINFVQNDWYIDRNPQIKIITDRIDRNEQKNLFYIDNFYPIIDRLNYYKNRGKKKKEKFYEPREKWDHFYFAERELYKVLKKNYKNKIWNEESISYDMNQSIKKKILLSYLSKIISLTKDIDAVDKKGMTALMYHSQYAVDVNFLKRFEKANANFKKIDNEGMTALHHAAKYNFSSKIILYFMDKIDVTITDKFNRTALFYAIKFNPNPKIAFLLGKKLYEKTMPKNFSKEYLTLIKNNIYFNYFPEISYKFKSWLSQNK